MYSNSNSYITIFYVLEPIGRLTIISLPIGSNT